MLHAIVDVVVLLLSARELAPALRGHFQARGPILPDTPNELAVEALGVLEQIRGAA